MKKSHFICFIGHKIDVISDYSPMFCIFIGVLHIDTLVHHCLGIMSMSLKQIQSGISQQLTDHESHGPWTEVKNSKAGWPNKRVHGRPIETTGPQNQDGLFWGDILWGVTVMRIQWFRKQFCMFFLGFWVAKIIRYNFKRWWILADSCCTRTDSYVFWCI